MTRMEFKETLQKRLQDQDLPTAEIKKSLDFYLEMIDDRIEDGMSEEDAVAALGDMDILVKEILLDAPLSVLVKQKIKPKKELTAKQSTCLILVAILGFPIWGALLIALLSVFFGIYTAIFSVIITIFAIVFAFMAVGIILIFSGIFAFSKTIIGAFFILGVAFLLISIAIFLIFPAKYATLGIVKLSKLFLKWVKSLFIGSRQKAEQKG